MADEQMPRLQTVNRTQLPPQAGRCRGIDLKPWSTRHHVPTPRTIVRGAAPSSHPAGDTVARPRTRSRSSPSGYVFIRL
jgi:hypothetical protein